MQKSKLETVKEQAKEKLAETMYSNLEGLLHGMSLPSNVERKIWISAMEDPEGESILPYWQRSADMYSKYEDFIVTLEDDIQKRGKDAILDVLDNKYEFHIDCKAPRIKKVLRNHQEMLIEIWAENKECGCGCGDKKCEDTCDCDGNCGDDCKCDDGCKCK